MKGFEPSINGLQDRRINQIMLHGHFEKIELLEKFEILKWIQFVSSWTVRKF